MRAGLRILYDDSKSAEHRFNVKKPLMDGNGNVWLPVGGIPKHHRYPRPRKAHLFFRLLKMGYLSIVLTHA